VNRSVMAKAPATKGVEKTNVAVDAGVAKPPKAAMKHEAKRAVAIANGATKPRSAALKALTTANPAANAVIATRTAATGAPAPNVVNAQSKTATHAKTAPLPQKPR
jgi:hypothetical protein